MDNISSDESVDSDDVENTTEKEALLFIRWGTGVSGKMEQQKDIPSDKQVQGLPQPVELHFHVAGACH